MVAIPSIAMPALRPEAYPTRLNDRISLAPARSPITGIVLTLRAMLAIHPHNHDGTPKLAFKTHSLRPGSVQYRLI